MDKLRRLWQVLTDSEVEYVDETPAEAPLKASDLFSFMKEQSAQNAEIMRTVAMASAAQSETMKTYIELFKPRDVKSTTLAEREAMREERATVRKGEWNTVENFDTFMGGSSIPPDPSEW